MVVFTAEDIVNTKVVLGLHHLPALGHSDVSPRTSGVIGTRVVMYSILHMCFGFIFSGCQVVNFILAKLMMCKHGLRVTSRGNVNQLNIFRPVELVYTEVFATCAESMNRETQLKRIKSHKYLQSLVETAQT